MYIWLWFKCAAVAAAAAVAATAAAVAAATADDVDDYDDNKNIHILYKKYYYLIKKMYKINKIETFLKLWDKFFIINKTSSFLIYMLYLYIFI